VCSLLIVIMQTASQPVEHCGIYIISWWKMSIMCVS